MEVFGLLHEPSLRLVDQRRQSRRLWLTTIPSERLGIRTAQGHRRRGCGGGILSHGCAGLEFNLVSRRVRTTLYLST